MFHRIVSKVSPDVVKRSGTCICNAYTRGKLSFILCIYMVGIFGHLSLTVLCHCTLIKNAIADSTYLGTCDLLSNVRKVGVAQNMRNTSQLWYRKVSVYCSVKKLQAVLKETILVVSKLQIIEHYWYMYISMCNEDYFLFEKSINMEHYAL